MRSAVLLLGLLISFRAAAQPVNAVIGDASFIATYGAPPGPDADEDLRLRTHLVHVERLLRAADTSALSPALRAARAQHLDRLHAYIERGQFPRNHAWPGRRPHFIDETGRICAVGYLVEQSAGRALAEAVNARHEWSFVAEIRDPAFLAWAAGSGLTLRELATIQPGYDHMQPVDPERPDPIIAQRVERVRQALLSIGGEVQQCAARTGFAKETGTITATVTLRHRAVRIDVSDPGGAALRRCVKRLVTVRTAAQFFPRPTAPVRITQVYAIAGGDGAAFDRETTERLVRAQVRDFAHCIDPASAGLDRVDAAITATIDPSGEFRAVRLDRPRRASSATGLCILAVLGRQTPPAFAGAPAVLAIDLR